MSFVFGPVHSRRFGLSLGIDVAGGGMRQCNFDCVYCELSPAQPILAMDNPSSVDEIVKEVKLSLSSGTTPDVLTVTANGEPTLYPHLFELAQKLNEIKGEAKLLILSNGSKICDENVMESLKLFDIVKLSLDCATKSCFRKLDRPLAIDLDAVIECMKRFRKEFGGELVMETLVVHGINDSKEEFVKLCEVLREIKPDRIDIGTIDRPPAFKVTAVTVQKLYELSRLLEGLNVNVASRIGAKAIETSLDNEAITALLANRPLTKDDVSTLFDHPTQERFWRLYDSGACETVDVAGVTFFKLKKGIS